MSRSLPLTIAGRIIAGICLVSLGCSGESVSPEVDNLKGGPQLSEPLAFEVTLVDGQQRYVDTETYEIWDADLAWEIDDMIENAPDLVDERTCDEDTLDGIRALIEGMPSRMGPVGIRRVPSDNLTWSELKRTYRPRPPKPEG